MNRLCFLILLLLNTYAVLADSLTFHRVAAQNGDGIYSLLRRYELDRHNCNFVKFYELNDLKHNAPLRSGKKYFIPVLIYEYNGKSIRSTIGIDSWQRAIKIQEYNERMLSENNRRMTFQKSKLLWVPYHALHCEDEKLPSSAPQRKKEAEEQKKERETTTANTQDETEIKERRDRRRTQADYANTVGGARQFPIFGKKYAYTPLISERLQGQVFYIVSGHGGPDPGAMTKLGSRSICEDEYSYDVALRLCRRLVANGATAYMITRDPNDGIRDGKYLKPDRDEVLWGNVRMYRQHKPRLFQRSNIINKLYEKHKKQGVGNQKLIAIHIDSRSKRAQTDLFFYYFPTDKKGRKLAHEMHQTIKSKYRKYRSNGQYSGTVSGRDLHMLRETLPTSVYVELGNIANAHDQKRIILQSNRDALAKWLYEGLTRPLP
ncbi:MAG: N-acetylmuramoyl-L-alanine amidase [Bacteroidota bacterium]